MTEPRESILTTIRPQDRIPSHGTQLTADGTANVSAPCWSYGDPSTRPDGLCRDCGKIDPTEVPDIHDPAWAGNTKPMEAIFHAPPNARTVVPLNLWDTSAESIPETWSL